MLSTNWLNSFLKRRRVLGRWFRTPACVPGGMWVIPRCPFLGALVAPQCPRGASAGGRTASRLGEPGQLLPSLNLALRPPSSPQTDKIGNDSLCLQRSLQLFQPLISPQDWRLILVGKGFLRSLKADIRYERWLSLLALVTASFGLSASFISCQMLIFSFTVT